MVKSSEYLDVRVHIIIPEGLIGDKSSSCVDVVVRGAMFPGN
jgi:hypothetical protein